MLKHCSLAADDRALSAAFFAGRGVTSVFPLSAPGSYSFKRFQKMPHRVKSEGIRYNQMASSCIRNRTDGVLPL